MLAAHPIEIGPGDSHEGICTGELKAETFRSVLQRIQQLIQVWVFPEKRADGEKLILRKKYFCHDFNHN